MILTKYQMVRGGQQPSPIIEGDEQLSPIMSERNIFKSYSQT